MPSSFSTQTIAGPVIVFSPFKTDAKAAEMSALALEHSFFAEITPVIIKAAQDAVLAAVVAPGSGMVKAAAAKDFAEQGIPSAVSDLKVHIQNVYYGETGLFASRLQTC